ncbi:hypothetical protein PAL_GLEAN10018612 [Pteropus alecto]|uniref:Uncharacterized protein n=1 Tax=Pteropus alecto TaxID=9402 RepID=L5JR93_PTEAL|nr:hypothetical protein PAL_GLEAN10018612 [Pteropus alecto]
MLTEVEARRQVSQATISTSGFWLVPGWRKATFPPRDLRTRRACRRAQGRNLQYPGCSKVRAPGPY